jgi:hypothetical protein
VEPLIAATGYWMVFWILLPMCAAFMSLMFVDSSSMQIAVPVWRMSLDKQVTNHRDEHEKYLTGRGFFS